MKPEVVTDQKLAETLTAIQAQLAVLNDRIATLEAGTAPSSGPAASSSGPAATQVSERATAEAPAVPAPEPEPLSEETILVISAAIAAYFGKRPRIRQIRLVSSTTWAQQGRVGIHASHAFPVLSRSGATS